MQFTNSQSGSIGAQSKFPKGVYVDLCTITKAENSESKYNDCNIFVEAEPVKGYPKKFYLGGNHHKDGKTMLDWGSSNNDTRGGSWKVCHFIETATGMKANEIELNEDGTIAPVTLGRLIGEQVYVLQYDSNGKYSRETWFYFGDKEGGKDFLLDKWNDMSPPKGYKHQSSNKALNGLWNEGAEKEKAEASLPF
tara:strand:- start:9418 stop:9999 length:582 start_codon:yes stop_codon:yes gene_type:complete